ncbi:MAG: hypothetical protein H6550_04120 [Chitinophagales bacterium]|nr:hypothetical protein [Chitinophagales bacterium]
MKAITAVLAAIFMFAVQPAEAHPYKRNVNKHQYYQHKRIQHGVRTGQLTRREAGALRMQQARVRNYKQMAMADGRVTHNERRMIQHAQMHANRSIYNKKHNNRTRVYR